MTKIYDLLEINTDGGARGNPGPAAIGVYAHTQGKKIFTLSETIGETTNNVAEYTAVIRSLETLLEKEIASNKLKHILDSELIVKQILGEYKVKQPHLKVLKNKVADLSKELQEKGLVKLMSFVHVPREENKSADSLVNKALDK
jgi:ribonuclease HI